MFKQGSMMFFKKDSAMIIQGLRLIAIRQL